VCIYVAQGIVPFDNLADSAEKCGDVLGEMELEDVVQGVRAITLLELCITRVRAPYSNRYCGLSERQWLSRVIISRRPH
jgi:hypothetical protein